MIIGGEQINRSICPPLPNFIDIFLRLRWNISTLTYNFFYSCDGISCFSTVTLESTLYLSDHFAPCDFRLQRTL